MFQLSSVEVFLLPIVGPILAFDKSIARLELFEIVGLKHEKL